MLIAAQTTKDKLLQAARVLVAREGFGAATTAAIAAEAGVAEGTLYRHFPSKDDLLIAAYRRLKADVFDALTAAGDASGPAAAKLKAFWLGLFLAYRADSEGFTFGQRFGESPLAEREGGAAHEAVTGALGRLHAQGVAEGAFKDLPLDLMCNLFFAPVGHMIKSELKGRRWTDAELDAAAGAVLDAWSR